jgi:addiction module RelE/StbE family toxin
MYSIVYAENVVRSDIPAIHEPHKTMIKRAIEERLVIDPIGFGKPLRYSLKGHRRLRVGDWRVIYRISADTVHIVKIGNRKDVY